MSESKRITGPIRGGAFFVKSNFKSDPKSCVYLITSKVDVGVIKRILRYPEYFRVLYKSNVDTYDHIALLEKNFRNRLDHERWSFLTIRPYYIDMENNLPPKENSRIIIDLIPDPSTELLIQNIEKRLKLFAKFFVLPDDSWKFEITSDKPFKNKHTKVAGHPYRRRGSSSGSSREVSPGTSPGAGAGPGPDSPPLNKKKQLIISFSDKVELHQIAMVKLLLSNDRWDYRNLPIYTHWYYTRE